MNKDLKVSLTITSATIFFIIGLIILMMYACPRYKVYSSRLAGEAELQQATYSKQVAVQEATAKMESATLLAKSDSLRAIGVAASNKIIGQSITQNYLMWLWINNLDQQKDKSVIYVPSQNGIPLFLNANQK